MNKLIDLLKKALEEEDYEEASRLKAKIEEINALYREFFGPEHQKEVREFLKKINHGL